MLIPVNFDRTDAETASTDLAKYERVFVYFANRPDSDTASYLIDGRVLPVPFYNELGEHCIAIERKTNAVAAGAIVRCIPIKKIDRIEA